MNVAWILRIESAAVGVLGIVAFLTLGGSPLVLIPALLAPDLSMLGYVGGPRVGSVTYNLGPQLGAAGGPRPAGGRHRTAVAHAGRQRRGGACRV